MTEEEYKNTLIEIAICIFKIVFYLFIVISFIIGSLS